MAPRLFKYSTRTPETPRKQYHYALAWDNVSRQIASRDKDAQVESRGLRGLGSGGAFSRSNERAGVGG